MAGMSDHKHRTTADKIMIAILSFAILLAVVFEVFAIVSMEMHTLDVKTGWKALATFAIFILICYRALRKRLGGLAKKFFP
jgi:TRAP-type C4-dicarboxylate transport system permease small subunit